MSGIDWQARARREAAAILAETDVSHITTRPMPLVDLLAVAWLQGVNYGSHETLAAAEEAFDRARAEL